MALRAIARETGIAPPSIYKHFADRDAVGNLATHARPYPSGVRDAQALWAALHGLVTLLPATPGFPWAPVDDIVDRLIGNLAG